jgi:hypothetical protein
MKLVFSEQLEFLLAIFVKNDPAILNYLRLHEEYLFLPEVVIS